MFHQASIQSNSICSTEMKSLLVLFLISSCTGFDKDKFLSHCNDISYYGMDLQNYEFLVCEDVVISPADAELFRNNLFNISNKPYITFERGNLGVVNGDFFKQFPNTKLMEFEDTTLSLKSSRYLTINSNLETLKIISSNVSGSHQSNSFHCLPRLKDFVLENCLLEDARIDGKLLQANYEMKKLTLIDDKNHPSNSQASILKHIDEDALDSLRSLEDLNIHVENMSQMPARFLKNKRKLKNIKLSGSLEEFPRNLPSSLEYLSIKFSKIRSLSSLDLKNLRKLKTLRISDELENIAADAFYGVDALETLNLSGNKLKHFSPRLLKYNKKISKVFLRKNFMDLKSIDFSSIGLKDDGFGVFVSSKMDLF